MIEKIQKYLFNMHKFDKKLKTWENLEKFNDFYKKFESAVKSEEKDKISTAMGKFIVELIIYSNSKNINFSKAIEDNVKLNF